MSTTITATPAGSRPHQELESSLASSLARLDLNSLHEEYLSQDEFLVVDRFLPDEVVARWDEELEALLPHTHRNYIPRHKKGGSVGYEKVREFAPAINGVYQSPAVKGCLARLAGAEMSECPDSDLHRCALYCYTEDGDHIGWHYDTSYYKDRRWTVLIGLRDNSNSRLECRLHTRQKGHAVRELSLQVTPGMMVLFNGDKVHHAVTPVGPGEQRFIVSMQYVTRGDMNPFMRFVSNMKDSIAYFGIRQVFFGRQKP